MNADQFKTLSLRDFENGAVTDDIYAALKRKDELEKLCADLVGQETAHQDGQLTPEYSPLEAGIALSLFLYNTADAEVIKRIWDHFEGHCAEPQDLYEYLTKRRHCIMTELALPTANYLMTMALEKYGQDAKERAKFLDRELAGLGLL